MHTCMYTCAHTQHTQAYACTHECTHANNHFMLFGGVVSFFRCSDCIFFGHFCLEVCLLEHVCLLSILIFLERHLPCPAFGCMYLSWRGLFLPSTNSCCV